jgi:UDP-GlcNAc:undecaprenyl-phosphate GlcNAc-1-phosphate transferase
MNQHLFIEIISIASLAFAIAMGSIPFAIVIGRKLGLVAHPAALPKGAEPTVEFGGAPIMGAILITLAAFHQLPYWIVLGASGLLLLGILDDAIELRPYQKFICQTTLCACSAIFALPLRSWTPWRAVDYSISILWLVTTTNAVNLIDGLDCLAAGVGTTAAVAIAAAGLMHHAPQVWIPSVAIVGALVGFMMFNFPPASIIMGDAGALPLGYLLGALALEGGDLATNSRLTAYVFPVLVMIVPLLDTMIVSVTRLATGSWISRRGADHSHHRLLSLGLTDRAAVLVCCAVSVVGASCGLAATILTHENEIVALPFLILATAVVALFTMDLTFESEPPGLAYGYAQGMARFILRLGYKQRVAEAAVDFALISGAYLAAQALRHDFNIDGPTIGLLLRQVPYVAFATYPAFVISGVYRGIWRYTSLSDGLRFANGSVLAGVFVTLASRVLPISVSGSIVVLFVILLFNLLMMTRISFQAIRRGIGQLAVARERVLVVGAGKEGAAAADFVLAGGGHNVRVIGFVDGDAFKVGKLMHGYRVLGSIADLESIYRAAPFQQLLLAVDDLSAVSLATISEFAGRQGVALRRFSIHLDEMRAELPAPAVDPQPAAIIAVPIRAPRLI